MSKLSIYRKLATLLVAALLGSLLLGGAAQAKRNTVEQQVQHYLECLDWMINDPAKHAKFCGPGHEWFAPDAAKNPVDNLPHPPVVVPPVVVPPVVPPVVVPPVVTDPCAVTNVAYVRDVGLLLAGGNWNDDPCKEHHNNPCEGMYSSAYYLDVTFGGGDCGNPCTDRAAFVQVGNSHGCGNTPYNPCQTSSLDTPVPAIVAVANRNDDKSNKPNDNGFKKPDNDDKTKKPEEDKSKKPDDKDFKKPNDNDNDRRPHGCPTSAMVAPLSAPAWELLAI